MLPDGDYAPLRESWETLGLTPTTYSWGTCFSFDWASILYQRTQNSSHLDTWHNVDATRLSPWIISQVSTILSKLCKIWVMHRTSCNQLSWMSGLVCDILSKTKRTPSKLLDLAKTAISGWILNQTYPRNSSLMLGDIVYVGLGTTPRTAWPYRGRLQKHFVSQPRSERV